jgi:Xaa-Pro aminopeptidase
MMYLCGCVDTSVVLLLQSNREPVVFYLDVDSFEARPSSVYSTRENHTSSDWNVEYGEAALNHRIRSMTQDVLLLFDNTAWEHHDHPAFSYLGTRTCSSEVQDVIWRMRIVKDAYELRCMIKAARIASQALAMAYALLHSTNGDKFTEVELSNAIHAMSRRNGSDGMSFPPIVAFGDAVFTLHHSPSDERTVAGSSRKNGQMPQVVIDIGPSFRWYASDFSESIWVANDTNDAWESVDRIVRACLILMLKTCVSGKSLGEVNLVARNFMRHQVKTVLAEGMHITDSDVDDCMAHQFMHWIGLDVHDVDSRMNSMEHYVLVPGMTLAVEPALYFPPTSVTWQHSKYAGIGVRVERTVAVAQEAIPAVELDSDNAFARLGL